ncbi:hypothetical protein OJAV_G00231230 [Oryzias javanicus]|uniref:Uncharacterized protein n=1 Tax=Oryzias javanicus TaxID=123683 RepID=A0A437BZQ1_ORYJA|nr:hypothetical protein OJAV_G00231230 [Oryzias javanicus]
MSTGSDSDSRFVPASDRLHLHPFGPQCTDGAQTACVPPEMQHRFFCLLMSSPRREQTQCFLPIFSMSALVCLYNPKHQKDFP